jgi:acetyl esterase/lipase
LTRRCGPNRSASIRARTVTGKTFDAFALRPYPADVAAADVTLGGVGAIELTVVGHPADPTVLYFHGGGYVAG